MEFNADFKNFGFSELSTKSLTVSSEILVYFTTYCEGKKKGFDKLNPKEYMHLVFSTLSLITILKEEISDITLTEEQKRAFLVFQRYGYRELTGEYEKNYLKYSLWRKTDFLKYSIDKYDIFLEEKNIGWKKIYAIPVPNYIHMEAIGTLILRIANKLGILDF
ncbi:hypothetical protein HNP86_001323 [Methanococcus maripaludis]|uniref:Uncharacterized protein n=1 Tax=Methanococcus maripaludis TaxID=39152 RepID=A0A7J9NU39_METMI|nr:hypothetical protein [Methanococcus maripaludis]MBA2851192.1 hypothetical protein [Methanococcus maripaludis]